MKVSAAVITFNEERNIGNCLASLSFADEIVVLDSGSTDKTEEICRSFPKVKFFHQPWLGYGKQKNRAVDLASFDWIFSLDADETVTSELSDDIRLTLQTPRYDGYTVRRKNFYRGKWVRHSGWWPDRTLRLFNKGRGRFSDRPLHESVVLEGEVGHLNSCIEHFSFSCVREFIYKGDQYSTLGAQMMLDEGKTTSAANALLRSFAAFVKTYLIKRGILDGTVGALIAFSNAMGVFYRHIKCLELQSERHDKLQ